mmetsp:Transcript_39687/g.69744  ORF Transcript_39687/g.69744 Transcript_39687/m.69744 type:complete len:305 (-) Transcript_39687:454-1368(-)
MRANTIFSILLAFLPSFSFLLAATISTTNALRQDEVSMGTTILAVRYKDGVVVGADTRTSVSGYVSNRYAAKLTFVLDRNVDNFVKVSSAEEEALSTCVICRSGSAADTQHLASVIRTELVSRQLMYRIRGTVTHVAALLRNILVDNDLSASLICAGYDHELGRGVLYTITPGGTVFEEKIWAAGGSGSTYILGHLDASYPKDTGSCGDAGQSLLQTEEEALEFVSDAIGLAMERDGSSGGFIRMYVIDRFGKRFVSMMPNGRNNNGMLNSKERIQSAGVPLRNFAPAAAPIEAVSGLSTGLSL